MGPDPRGRTLLDTAGILNATEFFFTAQALAHQEPVCGDAQTGVMVKTTPVTPFIVMQAQLRLQLLIIAFNPPSALCRGNQCLDRRLLWSRREPVNATSPSQLDCHAGLRTG
ncbi:putative ISXo8 transposase [Xanthomonas oryzae pv. oryzae KACC 10331]|uniref:ISXo8 transposase n=1 Tax=Xanthomonas oryzae pv. oryzae (strain KACC10331 / KXO85) TaxID=291331 RepID=Q05I16_XANOR|nr:putative ISXo8 transposase [Xanthomonas oryzae pv. oryzae KACC 10331]